MITNGEKKNPSAAASKTNLTTIHTYKTSISPISHTGAIVAGTQLSAAGMG